MNDLVLGPLLRHVDEDSACIWVETARAGTVRVEAGDSSGESRSSRDGPFGSGAC